MTINRDSVLFVGYALASAGLTVAGSHGWLSPADATEVTGVLTAFAVAFHIPNAKAAAALKAQDQAVKPSVTVVASQDASIDALMSGRAES